MFTEWDSWGDSSRTIRPGFLVDGALHRESISPKPIKVDPRPGIGHLVQSCSLGSNPKSKPGHLRTHESSRAEVSPEVLVGTPSFIAVQFKRFPISLVRLIPFQFGADSIRKANSPPAQITNSKWRPLWNPYVSGCLIKNKLLMGHKPALVQVLHCLSRGRRTSRERVV